MKKLLYLFFLCPMLAFSQASTDYLIFEIETMSASPGNTAQVENGLATHNKKYHATGASGVRVYTVQTGTHAGEYKWVMGPSTWSALDNRPNDDAHSMDWESNVGRYLNQDGNTEYIRFDPSMSRFPNDFNVDKLFVRYVDVARGKMKEAKEILTKIHKVYAEKITNETFGIYYNEIPSTSSGRDIVIVSFFNSYAWMASDDAFNDKYNAMYGKGSADAMWAQWQLVTTGQENEIWEYQEDLSGLPPMVKAADRQ